MRSRTEQTKQIIDQRPPIPWWYSAAVDFRQENVSKNRAIVRCWQRRTSSFLYHTEKKRDSDERVLMERLIKRGKELRCMVQRTMGTSALLYKR